MLSLPSLGRTMLRIECGRMLSMADDIEPDELDKKIERARKRMDSGRAELLALIDEALAAGRGPARIGRYAHWSEQNIRKIRDSKAAE